MPTYPQPHQHPFQSYRPAWRERGADDDRVFEALTRVPREAFVPEDLRDRAYADRALPLDHGQTISQPFIVALMTQSAAVRPGDRVLDVGTGSGYQAAVLAEMGAQVESVEILPELAETARRRLADLGYADRVTVHEGDGSLGWPGRAPYRAILVAAATCEPPHALCEQLEIGGRLVLPLGDGEQELVRIERINETRFREITLSAVAFVPLTGGGISYQRPED